MAPPSTATTGKSTAKTGKQNATPKKAARVDGGMPSGKAREKPREKKRSLTVSLAAQRKRKFLAALVASPNITAAAAAAGIERARAYRLRDSDPAFAEAWDAALAAAVDRLEAVAFQRAAEVSDTLLIFLLKSHRPERYQERTRHEHSGPDGAPITLGLFAFDAVAARLTERSETDR